ncbi:UbiA family prenyltransferase [Streptomyces sp. DSM 40712]|uniref:UbiA family prenyltransferase n=1 Tax=Streptomyces lancefieldiae TaxID=3075520 RepID=A0ABU3ASM4_9ACTN|nr:UbiA family prenyltransferase [Streptomyces sp. DSM 40712]MDT0613191.1 UbiA family prenyltransferase [Streptomyces sp. DSM 40712]
MSRTVGPVPLSRPAAGPGPAAATAPRDAEEPDRGGAGADGRTPGTRARARARARLRAGAGAWAELLRLPALFTVPGDVLAGAAATGLRAGPRTLLAIGSSVCLYEAGMALNDWADRAEDAAERPHRPIPSGRVRPAAALTAACGLTAAGLALAARAGRPAVAVAVPLAATVWAYDLALKHTPAGPVAMAAARGLDLLLGAAATGGDVRAAVPSAALLGTHTLAVTAVSREETRGGSSLAPLAALAATGLLARLAVRRPTRLPAGRREAATHDLPGPTSHHPDPGGAPRPSAASGLPGGSGPSAASGLPGGSGPSAASGLPVGSGPSGLLGRTGVTVPPLGGTSTPWGGSGTGGGRPLPVGPFRQTDPASPLGPSGPLGRLGSLGRSDRLGRSGPLGPSGPVPVPRLTADRATAALTSALTAAYAVTAARPYFHAALNSSPPLTQRAVGGGIRATIPLQATLTARAGGPATAALIAALAPLGRKFARKVSIT